MFGIYLSKNVYENLPPMLFYSGLVMLVLAMFLPAGLTGKMIAVGGLALMFAGFHAVQSRNRNRGREFRFGQLFYPVRSRVKNV